MSWPIKATNTDAGAAGLVVRVIVKERGGTYESFSTDDTWQTSVKEVAELESARVPRPRLARGEGLRPARRRAAVGRRSRDRRRRLAVHDRSRVRRRTHGDRRASRLADRDGVQRQGRHPRLAGRRAAAADSATRTATARSKPSQPFCDKLKNVQGILSLGTHVMAVGDGPDGGALYRSPTGWRRHSAKKSRRS